MKTSTRILSILILFLLLFTSGLSAQLLDKTLATVRLTDTEVVYERELLNQIRLLETQLGGQLNADQKNEILESRINSILIQQAAERAGLQASDLEIQNALALQKQSLGAQVSDEQYRQLVQQQTGLSWERYLQQLEGRILQEKYLVFARPNIGQNISRPTQAEIEAVYEQNASSFLSPAMSGVSHIFIPTRGLSDAQRTDARNRMDQFSRRIRNGGSGEFDAIIRESLDDPDFSGGDLGYVINGDQSAVASLGQSFVQAVLAMQQGSISQVMESVSGFHIVRVNDRRRPRLLELTDPLFPGQSVTVRQNIVQFIMSQKQQEALVTALNEIIEELREEAEIRIVEQNLPW